MSGQRTITAAVSALLLAPIAAPAQRPADTTRTSALCWTARPAPRCRVLLLTNFGVYADVPGNARLVGDVGLMINVSRHDALGASFYVTVDQDALSSTGAALRYRRWLTRSGSLELGVGARGAAHDGGALMGLVKVNFGPFLGLAVRPQIVRVCTWWGNTCMAGGKSTSNLRVSFGVELGSWPGAAAPGLLGAIAGVVYAARQGM